MTSWLAANGLFRNTRIVPACRAVSARCARSTRGQWRGPTSVRSTCVSPLSRFGRTASPSRWRPCELDHKLWLNDTLCFLNATTPSRRSTMAKDPKGSSDESLMHPLLQEKFREVSAAATGRGVFAYSVKIVCGKQTAGCCCVAGTRPGLYATRSTFKISILNARWL